MCIKKDLLLATEMAFQFEQMLRQRDSYCYKTKNGSFKRLIDMTDDELSDAINSYYIMVAKSYTTNEPNEYLQLEEELEEYRNK